MGPGNARHRGWELESVVDVALLELNSTSGEVASRFEPTRMTPMPTCAAQDFCSAHCRTCPYFARRPFLF